MDEYAVSTVPADGPAPNGAGPSAHTVTVLTKFVS